MDFLQGGFDLQTLRFISVSEPDISVRCEGASAYVGGRKAALSNVYDALGMALKDKLLSELPNHTVVELICDLVMNDFARTKDEGCDTSDLDNWLATANIAAACIVEMALPKAMIKRIALRLESSLKNYVIRREPKSLCLAKVLRILYSSARVFLAKS